MNLRLGETVADIGAGSGYYVTRFAPLVSAEGCILAQDVTLRYLADLDGHVSMQGLANVTVIRGEPHDPRLPAHTVEAAILVHMYH